MRGKEHDLGEVSQLCGQLCDVIKDTAAKQKLHTKQGMAERAYNELLKRISELKQALIG